MDEQIKPVARRDKFGGVWVYQELCMDPAQQSEAEGHLYSKQSIDALRAEVERLRALAGCAYQMAGVHDAPVVWLDLLSDGASGRSIPEADVISDLLLPYMPDAVCAAEAESESLRAMCRDMLPVFEAARPLVLNLERLRDAAKQEAGTDVRYTVTAKGREMLGARNGG